MTGKKRGLSLDEKRDKVLEIFYETSDVFVLKDIEKMAVKKGVTFQSIKEVVQSLVDDDLLHQEKIGTSNFFWAFPSEASVKLKRDLDAAESRVGAAKRQKEDLTAKIAEAKGSRDDSGKLEAKISELQELEQKKQSLSERLKALNDSDPALFQEISAGVPTARDAANRWLDNVYALQDWTKKKFVGMEGEVDKFFLESGLTDDIDYVE